MKLIKIARRKEAEEKLVVMQRPEKERERETDAYSSVQSSLTVYTEATMKQIVLIRSSRYLFAGEF